MFSPRILNTLRTTFCLYKCEKMGQLIVRLIHASSLIVRVCNLTQFVLVYIELVCHLAVIDNLAYTKKARTNLAYTKETPLTGIEPGAKNTSWWLHREIFVSTHIKSVIIFTMSTLCTLFGGSLPAHVI